MPSHYASLSNDKIIDYEENGKAAEEHDYLGRYVVMSYEVNSAGYRAHNDVIAAYSSV